jgi:AcrR family transcriptional regulator
MNILKRKQREFQQREELILSVAYKLLLELGYLGLTIDRIAEATEYSKGTIYQHFSCKEDILIALSTRTMQKRIELFERAAIFKGKTRERITAIAQADELFVLLYPDHFRLEQIFKIDSLWAKTSPERRERLLSYDFKCLTISVGIVRDAIAHGDLPESRLLKSPEDLVYALVSLTFGSHSLALKGGAITQQLGIENPFSSIRLSIQSLLDGVGWRPLTSEWDYELTYDRIQKEVFPDECRRAHLSIHTPVHSK